MRISGVMTLPQKHWKDAYKSFLVYANQEVNQAYLFAMHLHSKSHESLSDIKQAVDASELTPFQKELVLNSFMKENQTKVYKPKKNFFKKFTNRSTYMNLGDFEITFDKVTNTISFESIELNDSLHENLRETPFIGQFINMSETIEWPRRDGPKKAIRGCRIVYILDETVTEFYLAGNNPPPIKHDLSIVAQKPKFLEATQLKKIKINQPLTSETHTQPVSSPVDPEFF